MNQSSLDALATHLAAHLDCTQDVACRQIMQAMAETGQPLAPVRLARRLQMSQEIELDTLNYPPPIGAVPFFTTMQYL